MEFQLTPDEQQLLLDVLQESMRELSRQISHTDCHDFRRMLRCEQELLENLSSRLVILLAA
jgi:hypothetical protein